MKLLLVVGTYISLALLCLFRVFNIVDPALQITISSSIALIGFFAYSLSA